jgi:hypothetical protein
LLKLTGISSTAGKRVRPASSDQLQYLRMIAHINQRLES